MKVLTFADLHLRYTVSSCVDATQSEWMDIQEQALNKVIDIATEELVDEVYVGGDIFHSVQSTSFECIVLFQNFAKTLNNRGIKVHIIAGNHDLYGHSSSNTDKSAYGILLNSNDVYTMNHSYIKGCNFDVDDYGDSDVIFKHTLCMPEKPQFIDCETPETLLAKYPSANFIFTGDYHRNFVYEKNNRFVINSGCLTKQASDFEDYETGVYVTNFDNNEIKWCPVNIEQKFVKNSEKKNNNRTFDDFVNGIKRESVTLDFVGEVKKELVKQDKPVQEVVTSWIESNGQ